MFDPKHGTTKLSIKDGQIESWKCSCAHKKNCQCIHLLKFYQTLGYDLKKSQLTWQTSLSDSEYEDLHVSARMFAKDFQCQCPEVSDERFYVERCATSKRKCLNYDCPHDRNLKKDQWVVYQFGFFLIENPKKTYFGDEIKLCYHLDPRCFKGQKRGPYVRNEFASDTLYSLEPFSKQLKSKVWKECSVLLSEN